MQKIHKEYIQKGRFLSFLNILYAMSVAVAFFLELTGVGFPL